MYGSSLEGRAGRAPTGRRNEEVLRAFMGWTILTFGMTVALITRARNPVRG